MAVSHDTEYTQPEIKTEKKSELERVMLSFSYQSQNYEGPKFVL